MGGWVDCVCVVHVWVGMGGWVHVCTCVCEGDTRDCANYQIAQNIYTYAWCNDDVVSNYMDQFGNIE